MALLMAALLTLGQAQLPQPQMVTCWGAPAVPLGQRCPVADYLWFVFFAPNSTRLSREAEATLDQVIAASRTGYPFPPLTLNGHADRAERGAGELSRRRGAVVRDYLVRHGLATALRMKAQGEARPAGTVRPDQHDPQNRRVEIVYEP